MRSSPMSSASTAYALLCTARIFSADNRSVDGSTCAISIPATSGLGQRVECGEVLGAQRERGGTGVLVET